MNSFGRYSYIREGAPTFFLNRALLRLNPALPLADVSVGRCSYLQCGGCDRLTKSSRSVPAAAARGPDGGGGGDGGQAIVEVTIVICTSAEESTRNRRNTTLKSHAHGHPPSWNRYTWPTGLMRGQYVSPCQFS